MKRVVILSLTYLVAAMCAVPRIWTTSAAPENPDGVLVTVRGQVSVKRKGWDNYASISEGAPLNRGDLLRVGRDSVAVVLCADGSRKPIPIGDSGVPCSAVTAAGPSFITLVFWTIFKGISLVGPTRSNTPIGVPIIVSPRGTKLLNSSPILRWTAGAAPSPLTYHVSVKSGGREIWSEEVVGKTEIVYSGKGPQALTPGESYRLVVSIKGCTSAVPGDCSSDKEEEPERRTFTLVNSGKARQVQQAVAELRALDLKDDLTQLLIAKYYASEGLLAESISILETLSGTMALPAVHQALGDAYLSIGLVRFAAKQYGDALRLAQNAKDIEGQAIAQTALGGIYLAVSNREGALLSFQKAKELYRGLGDVSAMAELDKRISEVGKP